MIRGEIDSARVPCIRLRLGGRVWKALIDTGFNGDLELPDGLMPFVNAIPHSTIASHWAAGLTVRETQFVVQVMFDGEIKEGMATFVKDDLILIGTRFLREYRLIVDFPAKTVSLRRKVRPLA